MSDNSELAQVERGLEREIAQLRADLAEAQAKVSDLEKLSRDDLHHASALVEAKDVVARFSMCIAGLKEKLDDERAAHERTRAELERSRYKGGGSYPRAIGEIEGLLGISSEVPLSETVAAVRALVADLATAQARVAAAESALASAREQTERDRLALINYEVIKRQLQAELERVRVAMRPYAGTSGCWWAVNEALSTTPTPAPSEPGERP